MARIYDSRNIRWGPNQLASLTLLMLNNAKFLPGFLLFSLVLINFPTASAQGNIRPFYPLYFTAQPKNAIVASGRSVTLNCTVMSASQPVTLRWLRGQSEVDTSNSNFVHLSNGALRINSVTRTEQGSYHCTAEDTRGKMIISQDAVLSIASLSSNIPSPEDVSVYEGDTARFKCQATGTPRPRISWQKDGSVLDLTMEIIASRFALLPSGALEIRNIRSIDGGSYRCQATNDVTGQTVTSRTASLTVVNGLPDPNREFEFIVNPQDVEARIGRNIVLEAATTEPAAFTWFKDDEEIVLFTGQDHYSIVGQGSLRISDLGEIDTGLYRVRASSGADGSTLTKTVRITAQVPPSFLVKPEDAHANVGNPFTFKCSVYGIPHPDVRWFKNGEEIDTSDTNIFRLVNGQNLQISQLIKEDDGTYQCVASNYVENVKETIEAAAELIVLDEGVPIPPKLTTTTTTIVVTTIKPTTTAVPGPATGPVPSKPRQLTASRILAQSVTAKWREPTTKNGEIQSYRIHIQAEGAKRQRIISVPGNRLQWEIDDLVSQTTYNIYTYAVNENGPGERSETLTIETQGVVQVPGSPQNLVALADSATSIYVSWEPPSSTFGDIQNYQLYYADLGTGQATREQEIQVTDTSYTVTGLSPYTRYGFRVEAFNENGPGPSSETIEARTFTDKPTSPPSNVTARPFSASSILLSWNLPPTSQRNGDITGYKVRYRLLENSDRAKTIVVDGILREFILSELERDSEYEIRIGAVNVNGTGPFTDWIPSKTLRDDQNEDNQPPPPAYLEVTSYPTKIQVRWGHPRDTSILVRGYMLGYGIGYPDRKIKELSSTTTDYMISNLQANAQYVIRLRAFNLKGEGFSLYETVYTRQDSTVDPVVPVRINPVPESSGTTSPPEVLKTPLELRAVIKSASSALLSWADMEEGCCDGRHYQFMYKANYPANQKWFYVNTTDLTYALNGLQPYTMYEFKVRVVKDEAISGWSMITSNKTYQAAPTSAPKELTIYEVENSTTSLQLNWQPPRQSNGIITGYTIYYSTDATLPIEEWIEIDLEGEDLTTIIPSLTQDTMYHFRIQGHNVKGDSPISGIVSDTTPPGPPILVTAIPPDPITGAAAFPWWLWLVIVATIFLLLLLAILIVLCLVCGCCACCASCCPDSDCCGPFGPCCGALARCWTSMCPCCCSDEEECAKCCASLCCGATCCVCFGQQYKEKRKFQPKGKVNANGKIGNELDAPDLLWAKGGQSSDRDMTKSPLATELEPLNPGGGVDQHRGGMHETEFGTGKRHNQALIPNGSPLYATVANRSGSSDHANQSGEEHRSTTKVGMQSDTYETPTISHRSSYESGLPSSLPSMAGLTWSDGALNYASIYDKKGRGRMNGYTSFDDRRDTETHLRSGLDTWAEEDGPPVKPRTTSVKIKTRNRRLSDGDGAFDVLSPTSTSANASRYNTWGAGARGLDSHHNDYHSSTYHRDDREFDYRTRDYSSLHSDGFVPIRTGPEIQTLDRRHARSNYDVNSNQLVTFPDGHHYGGAVQETKPFTITFEETKTSHQVERSVPMLDGTSYKTVSNHETFAKSYSTSDAAKDGNLQMMLQNGLENGPLAIELPTTSGTSLPAITAPIPTLIRPGIGRGSLTTESRTTSSSPSSASYHMGTNNYMQSENAASINLTSNPLFSEENAAHSLGASSYAYGQSNMSDQQSTHHQRLGRSNSLDYVGLDVSSLPPLGDTKKIRPPLLPHRPRAPPDYDTVSRAKKKAASAYNLSATDASEDFFTDRGSAFNPFRSSEFLFSGTGPNTDRGTSSSSTQTKYNTMESSSRGGITGLNADASYSDHNNSFGFETGAGASGGATENAFSSSMYGTSIGSRGLDVGVTNGGLLSNGGISNGGLTNGSDMHMGGVPGYDYATSPRSLHLNQPPYMYSSTTATSGYHSDTNTVSSHEDSTSQMSSVSRPTNPLSSFTVPGPPPHYQGRVKMNAPTYSPLKKTQAGFGTAPRGRGQPLPVVTPRAPDVTVTRGPGGGTSPTSSARTFSAEDLNAEMINLEGLMKDLNAITASELQS
ncbi:uncharacterized protein [Amphiura filiformis]|uniref:uncharacterized protein isoform X3 n=1 Tax=Amphiura filiformis TaxID=82378 RepID=UPI003B217001